MSGTTDTIVGAAVAIGVLGAGMKIINKATEPKKIKKITKVRRNRGFL